MILSAVEALGAAMALGRKKAGVGKEQSYGRSLTGTLSTSRFYRNRTVRFSSKKNDQPAGIRGAPRAQGYASRRRQCEASEFRCRCSA